jgi:L-alanine-DL-glutamate epimerase-like enolase superfamily enzyme
MKIQRVTVEVLETPLSSQYSAGGSPVDSNWHILARIYTEDGIQGIGFNVALRPTLVKAAAQACQELGDLLVGMEVMEIEAARSRMERAAGWAGPGGMVCIATAPLDIALWDAAGKIANQPLYRMLGGYRDRVRTYASDTLWYSLSLDGLAHLSQALDVPIAAGERLFGVEPFVRTLEARAVNTAIIDLARVGASRPG